MPKCCICKKDLKKEDAYIFIHISKTGKEYRKYACSKEEVEQDEREKELYKLCQYESDKILGRPITNNARNKELREIHESGYSWEQIYRCIKAKADDIRQMIEYKHIENDYQQIRYCMQVIKNCIYDFSKEDEKKNDWSQYIENTIEEVDENKVDTLVEESDDDIKNRLNNNKNKSTGFADLLNKLK